MAELTNEEQICRVWGENNNEHGTDNAVRTHFNHLANFEWKVIKDQSHMNDENNNVKFEDLHPYMQTLPKEFCASGNFT